MKYKVNIKIFDKDKLVYVKPYFDYKSVIYLLLIIFSIIIIAPYLVIKNEKNVNEQLRNEIKKLEKKNEYNELKIKEKNLNELIGKYIQLTNDEVPELNTDNIRKILNLCDISGEHADCIIKQSILESGHFKSSLFKNTNNLFGMFKPRKRNEISCDKANQSNYAVYKNWVISLLDRVLWEMHTFKNKPELDEYIKHIEENYSMTEDYISRLENIKIDN